MIVKHYTSFITVFMLLISLQRGNTQTDEYIKQQLPQATQYDVAIIDSVFGIKMYEIPSEIAKDTLAADG